MSQTATEIWWEYLYVFLETTKYDTLLPYQYFAPPLYNKDDWKEMLILF